MGTEAVAPSWPALTSAECHSVLASYPELHSPGAVIPVIEWHSPRPFSSAAVLRFGARQVFIKRHWSAIRGRADLIEEHDFIQHLQKRGIAIPRLLLTADGDTVVQTPEWTYEVHAAASAHDSYREALSWTPFISTAHAASAGAMLARLHLAAEDFDAPARRTSQLVTRFEVLAAPDPIEGVRELIAAHPNLGVALSEWDWRVDFERWVLPWHAQLAGLLSDLPPLWTHNDWHASNLLWSEAGRFAHVSTVLDFGLSNRTTAIFDLATACERNTVAWLDLAPEAAGVAQVRLDQLEALIRGYLSQRPLSAAERRALPLLLPIVHVEFALSELEYFHGLLGSVADAELAYRDYLLGHLRWFAGAGGERYLERMRTVLSTG